MTIAPAGTVTGTFVGPDGRTPIANANVVIASGAVNTYTTTDALGRFEGESIPIGTVNVSAIDPLTGRAAASSGALGFQGDFIDLTLVQVPRGTVEGRVVEADGFTPVAGAQHHHERVRGNDAERRSYRFEGMAGPVAIVERDPISGATGSATTTIEFENGNRSSCRCPWRCAGSVGPPRNDSRSARGCGRQCRGAFSARPCSENLVARPMPTASSHSSP